MSILSSIGSDCNLIFSPFNSRFFFLQKGQYMYYSLPSSDKKYLTNHILRFYIQYVLVHVDGIVLNLTQEMQLHDVFSRISLLHVPFYSMLKVAIFDFIPLVYILFEFIINFQLHCMIFI